MTRTARCLVALVVLAGAPALAQNVKITPLGSHAGELCARDRATLFEDPTGVRILYDAGHSVTGGDDARLGSVHVVLLSHAHGDHIGDQKLKAAEAGTTVTAAHDSTVPRELLSESTRKSLEADSVSLTLGPSTGYVIRFTNGLTVYLSGDTGLHAEQKSVVADFHKANLMLLNMGPTAVTTHSAAYVANELVRPNAVIATHVNEGATTAGKLKPNSRTAAFVTSVKGRPVYPALSGKTMEFDGDAKCVAGC